MEGDATIAKGFSFPSLRALLLARHGVLFSWQGTRALSHRTLPVLGSFCLLSIHDCTKTFMCLSPPRGWVCCCFQRIQSQNHLDLLEREHNTAGHGYTISITDLSLNFHIHLFSQKVISSHQVPAFQAFPLDKHIPKVTHQIERARSGKEF